MACRIGEWRAPASPAFDAAGGHHQGIFCFACSVFVVSSFCLAVGMQRSFNKYI